MHQRTTHHSPLFLGVLFALSLIILATSISVCTAQDVGDNNPCIILAKSGELYDLELYSLVNGTGHTIILSFDFDQNAAHRLEVQEPYIGSYDIGADVYCIHDDSGLLLCSLKYVGLQTVLIEERAKLEVHSTSHQAHLVGVYMADTTMDVEIPASFGIILALCSLVPFFLLAPDVISDLQMHLEAEAASKGVYGRILALLLPLLTIGMTFWLLESLSVFR